jgi:hypothetical protein
VPAPHDQVRRAAGEGEAGQLAHGGPPAVAADQVGGGDPAAGDRRGDARAVLGQIGERVLAQDRHAEAGGVPAEQLLQLRLPDEAVPALRFVGRHQVDLVDPGEVAPVAAVRRPEVGRTPLVVLGQRRPEPPPAQRLGGQGADTARLALRARPRQPLHDDRAHPGQRQLGGQQQPDRSRADDEHIRIHGISRQTRLDGLVMSTES